MILVLVSLVAVATAAPQGVFDLSTDRRPEIHLTEADVNALVNIYPNPNMIGITMDSFNIRYMPDLWSVETNKNQYMLSMSVPDYDKKDINVLASQDTIIIKVVHKEQGRIVRSQIAIGVLPATINPAGRWTYDGHIIKIVFPLRTADQQKVIVSDADEESTAVRLVIFDN